MFDMPPLYMKILQSTSLYNPVANYMLEFLSEQKVIKDRTLRKYLRYIFPSARSWRRKLQGIFILLLDVNVKSIQNMQYIFDRIVRARANHIISYEQEKSDIQLLRIQ